ncbi:MAG: nucleotidyltransferase domain-containing protein [Leptolyngbyaceae cyanobacterium bins.302]|nr:nucleotidyltransferase domain-containing protein [Leptolyngbyaceae cyanobacterium bins.302]
MSFPTPLLDAKLAQLREQSEHDRQHLLQAAIVWLHHHAIDFGFEQGYLFGSVTQPGRFSPDSDIDLAIDSLNQGDPFGLGSYLSLHLDREVDVVPLDRCHFADKIRQTGIAWNVNKLPD